MLIIKSPSSLTSERTWNTETIIKDAINDCVKNPYKQIHKCKWISRESTSD
jgi:hypothetical protein